jgi:hypothetical protein
MEIYVVVVFGSSKVKSEDRERDFNKVKKKKLQQRTNRWNQVSTFRRKILRITKGKLIYWKTKGNLHLQITIR